MCKLQTLYRYVLDEYVYVDITETNTEKEQLI
jgi:hypothetical protein